MNRKKQIEEAAGAYYRANEARNRSISSAALKSWKDGARWADANPASPWRPVTDLPASAGFVLVWCIDEDGHEAPMMAAYAEGYFDLLGMMFWTPIAWMPIPAVPGELVKEFIEV